MEDFRALDNFLSGGHYLLFEKLSDTLWLTFTKEGILTIFDIDKKYVLRRKRLSNHPVLTALFLKDVLYYLDEEYNFESYHIPSLKLGFTYGINRDWYEKSYRVHSLNYINFPELKVVFLLNDEHLIFFGSKGSIGITPLPEYLKGSYILSTNGARNIRLLSPKFEVYSLEVENQEPVFKMVKFFKAEDSIKTFVYRKTEGKHGAIVFHERALRTVLVIDEKGDSITRVGTLRDEYLSAFYYDNSNTLLLIGTEEGVLYYSFLKTKKELKRVRIGSYEISMIRGENGNYLILDKHGGLFKVSITKKGVFSTTIFPSREPVKISITPDYENPGNILIRERGRIAYILNYKEGNGKIVSADPFITTNFHEAMLLQGRGIFVIFKASIAYIYNFDGELVDTKNMEFVKPFVIKRFEENYYLGTELGFFTVISKDLVQKNLVVKLSKFSILMMDTFKVKDTLYLCLSTSNGEQILYRFIGNTRVYNMKTKVSDVISNSIVVGEEPAYFVFSTGGKIIAINIADKLDKYEVTIADNVKISFFFKFSSFRNDEFSIMDIWGNVYKLTLNDILLSNYIYMNERVIYRFNIEIDDSTIRVIGDDLIVSDIYGGIHILTYAGFDGVELEIEEKALSILNPEKKSLMISGDKGDLFFIDLESNRFKKETINDWILRFIRFEENKYIAISYRGNLFNVVYNSDNIDYFKAVLNFKYNVLDFAYSHSEGKLFILSDSYKVYEMDLKEKRVVKKVFDRKVIANTMELWDSYLILFTHKDMVRFKTPENILFYNIKTGKSGEAIIDYNFIGDRLIGWLTEDVKRDLSTDNRESPLFNMISYFFHKFEIINFEAKLSIKEDYFLTISDRVENLMVVIMRKKDWEKGCIMKSLYDEIKENYVLIFSISSKDEVPVVTLLAAFPVCSPVSAFIKDDKVFIIEKGGKIIENTLSGADFRTLDIKTDGKMEYARNNRELYFINFNNKIIIKKLKLSEENIVFRREGYFHFKNRGKSPLFNYFLYDKIVNKREE